MSEVILLLKTADFICEISRTSEESSIVSRTWCVLQKKKLIEIHHRVKEIYENRMSDISSPIQNLIWSLNFYRSWNILPISMFHRYFTLQIVYEFSINLWLLSNGKFMLWNKTFKIIYIIWRKRFYSLFITIWHWWCHVNYFSSALFPKK